MLLQLLLYLLLYEGGKKRIGFTAAGSRNVWEPAVCVLSALALGRFYSENWEAERTWQ
jgi:hypothetical protein